jgi:hypothetical protein
VKRALREVVDGVATIAILVSWIIYLGFGGKP